MDGIASVHVISMTFYQGRQGGPCEVMQVAHMDENGKHQLQHASIALSNTPLKLTSNMFDFQIA